MNWPHQKAIIVYYYYLILFKHPYCSRNSHMVFLKNTYWLEKSCILTMYIDRCQYTFNGSINPCIDQYQKATFWWEYKPIKLRFCNWFILSSTRLIPSISRSQYVFFQVNTWFFKSVRVFMEDHANMGLDFVSGQYECLFSRCRKYVINSLIHGHFHIGLVVIIPRPILVLDSVSGQYGGLGMITRPLWKCPCINLYVLTDIKRLQLLNYFL